MNIPQALKDRLTAELLQRMTMHTAQAIGGVITFTAVDVGALSHGQYDTTKFSQLAAGVLVQSAVVLAAHFMASWRKRQAVEKVTGP